MVRSARQCTGRGLTLRCTRLATAGLASLRERVNSNVRPLAVDLRVRQWSKLRYLDPVRLLQSLRHLELTLPLHTLPLATRELRTHGLRKYNEGRQAAIFCHGMSSVVGVPVHFAHVPNSDFDIIARCSSSDTHSYVPVQLKELVPSHVNAEADLQTELSKIAKYVDSKDLVVAFYLNTQRRIEFARLKYPVGVVAELWFFGATTPDSQRWVLAGNMLTSPVYGYEFTYPGA
jgi:hypothetical protein